jgi:hypothetical protein
MKTLRKSSLRKVTPPYWLQSSAAESVERGWYGGSPMSGKKDYDATKKLPEGEPTQDLPGGTKVGLPKREDVFSALRKVIGKPQK